jgi:Protein of unknown function (DUF1153)
MQNNDHRYAKARFTPNENRLTIGSLPISPNQRWVASRKTEIVAAVRGGRLTLDEACERYGITSEEYLAWQDAMAHFGSDGLQVKNLQAQRRENQR